MTRNEGQKSDVESELQSSNAALASQLELQKQETLAAERALAVQEQQKIALASQLEILEKRKNEDEQALLAQQRKNDELQLQIGQLQKAQSSLEETLSLERAVAAKSDNLKSREAMLAGQVKAAQDKQTESTRQIETLERKLRETEYSLSSQQKANESLTTQNKDLLSAAQANKVAQQQQQQQQRSASETEKKLRETESLLVQRTNEVQRLEGVISEGRKYDQQRELQFEELKKKLWEGEELQGAQQQLNEELIAQINASQQQSANLAGQQARITQLEKKCLDAEEANMRLRKLHGNKNGHEHLSEISDLRDSLAARDRDLEEMSAIFDQMQREKDAAIESLKKELAHLRESPNELEPPSPRLSTGSGGLRH